MQQILLTVELRDQASASTKQVSQAMALLEAATTKASTATDALDAVTKRAAATLDLLTGSARSATGALDTLTGSITALGREFGGLDTSARAAGAALDGQIASFTGVRDASVAAALAIRDQTDALLALAAASRVAVPVAANTVAGSSAARAASGIRLGRVSGALGAGIATDAGLGLGGRVLNAALGPEGLAVGAALYGGYKAAQASNAFYSNLAGLASATGTPQGEIAPVGTAALRYAGTGRSQFSPIQATSQGQQYLAAGVAPSTYAQIIPQLAQGSALLSGMAGGNIQTAADALTQTTTDLANTFGRGKDTSAAMFEKFIAVTVTMDQFAKSAPGALAANISKLLPASMIAGASLTPAQQKALMPEVLGLAVAETHTGASTRLATTDLARLISNVFIRTPTPAQERAALGLGVQIGPQALQTYGSITGFIQQVVAGQRRDPNAQADLYALGGTTNSFRALTEIIKQMELGATKRFVGGITNVEASAIPTQYKDYLASSPQAQFTGIANQFNTDLINAGKTLTDTFQPDLIAAAKAILSAADGAGDKLGAFGHKLDQWSAQLNLPKQFGPGSAPAAVGHFFDRVAATVGLQPGTTGFGPGDDTSGIRAAGRARFGTGAQPAAPAPAAPPSASSAFFNPSRFVATIPPQTGPASATLFNPAAFTATPSQAPAQTPTAPAQDYTLDVTRRAYASQTRLSGIRAQQTQATAQQASDAYRRLTPDAQAVLKAQDDLNNKIVAGLPIDNVTRQLDVYRQKLAQLKTDLGAFQTAETAKGLTPQFIAQLTPGISDTTIANQQQRANKAVGQYGYALARTQLNQDLPAYQAGQLPFAQIQTDLQAVLTAVNQMPAAQQRTLDWQATQLVSKAFGSVQRSTALAGAQQNVTDAYGALTLAQQSGASPEQIGRLGDAYFKAQRKAAADQYQGPSKAADLIKADRSIDQQQRAFNIQNVIGPADQLRVQAAQQDLDAARMMGETPDKINQINHQYLDQLRQFYKDTLTGKALQVALTGVDKQQATGDYATHQADVSRGARDIQNRIAIDQATGNLGDLAKAFQALEAYQKANAGPLGLDASDLARQRAEDQRALRGLITPTPPPFRQNQPGLGALQAGPGGTAVRFGGGQDPQLEEIRRLREENALLRRELGQKLDQLHTDNMRRNQEQRARGATPPQ